MDGDGGSDGSGDSGSGFTLSDSGGSFSREDLWIALLILSICIAIVSGLFSVYELRYAIWGKIVEAQVHEAKIVRIDHERNQPSEKLTVAYSFAVEGGEVESASDVLPKDWPRPDRTIAVQYVSGRRIRSRVAGHENKSAYCWFLASLAVLAGVIFKFYLEAKASERRPVRRYH